MDTAHVPIHPGEILAEEFLGPLGITKYRLAKTIDVPATRIGEIIRGTRNVSPDTALRLSKALGTSERFWMNLQSHYDLEVQRELLQAELERIKPLVAKIDGRLSE
ncbi:HigA family addiction module antitoxin [Naasia lichenicola]|nr:HigA family addiction module antitoxin [Naasia lichenicola]